MAQSWRPSKQLASTDAEEGPDVDTKGHAKTQGDVEQLGWIGVEWNATVRGTVDDVGAAKGKEEEEEGSDEFAGRGNEMVPGAGGEVTERLRDEGLLVRVGTTLTAPGSARRHVADE